MKKVLVACVLVMCVSGCLAPGVVYDNRLVCDLHEKMFGDPNKRSLIPPEWKIPESEEKPIIPIARK